MRPTLAVLAALPLMIGCGDGSSTSATGPTGNPSTPTGPSIALTFCAGSLPVWLAYQNENGAWTRATPDGSNVFHVGIEARGGVATVVGSSLGGYHLGILYATASQLSAIYGSCPASGTGGKTIRGTMLGLNSTDLGEVAMGQSSAAIASPTTAFTLTSVPDAATDLVAVRSSLTNGVYSPARLIVRRGVNVASGTTLPALDFGGSESVVPATATLAVNGIGADDCIASTDFQTSLGTAISLSEGWPCAATVQYAGVPASSLVSGDVHLLEVSATPTGGIFPLRSVLVATRSIGNRTVTIGPAISAITASAVAGSATRYHAQFATQAAYATIALAGFTQNASSGGPGLREVLIEMTSDYNASSPATWDLSIPDFTSVPGYSTTYGLQTGAAVAWEAAAYGGVSLPQLIAGMTDGQTLSFSAQASLSISAASLRAFSMRPMGGRSIR